ncbi:MAG: TlpA family protein disulfide reductase [Bacteroidales bacterium]|nr:TlpA family protein disulfide reductase [Bacteroidales bacterium]
MKKILLFLFVAVIAASCSKKNPKIILTLKADSEIPVDISDNLQEIRLEPNAEGKYEYEFKNNDYLISWLFIGNWPFQFYVEKDHDLEVTVEIGLDEKGNINLVNLASISPYYEKTNQYLFKYGRSTSLISSNEDFAMKEMDFYKNGQKIIKNFQANLEKQDLPVNFKTLEKEKIKHDILGPLSDHELGYKYLNKIKFEDYQISEEYKDLLISNFTDSEIVTGIMHNYWMSLSIFLEKALKIQGETIEENFQLRVEQCKKMFKNPKLLERIIFCEFVHYLSYDISKPTEEILNLTKVIKNKDLKKRLNNLLDQKNKIKKGKKAFNFTCKDINGKEYKLSDFKGKVVVIDLWATWCKPCMEVLPYFIEKQKQYSTRPVHFITLSVDKNEEAWKKKVKKMGLDKNSFIAIGSNNIMKAFGLSGIPATIIIDKDGHILDGHAKKANDPLFDTELNSYLQ